MKNGVMLDEQTLQELYAAAERLRLIFAPLAGRAPCAGAIDRAETEARGAFGIVYRHLHALASAELQIRLRGPAGLMLGALACDPDELAHMSAETPFLRRNGDGLLEIADLLLRFFSGGSAARGEDLFFYLKRISKTNVSQVIKQTVRNELPVRYYVSNAVNRHIASSPRYERRGGTVIDSRGSGGERRAGGEEIVSLAAPDVAAADTPGRIVDVIFDRLRDSGRYRPELDIAALRSAVFELVRGRYLPPPRDRSTSDPLHECIESEILRQAAVSVENTVAAYRWQDKPSALREAYRRAGIDYLEEIVRSGGGTPHHELLGRHLDGCDAQTYRKTHMGGFQHFLGLLWSDFLKNIRAEA